MPGMNTDRVTGAWSTVAKAETRAKAARAQEVYESGNSITFITKVLKATERQSP
ncbi:MAG TPA: hypothetical protein VN033_09340 [Vulgatibacter sp.]|nr:hypothetical protein [Vulgatibacter sp.]